MMEDASPRAAWIALAVLSMVWSLNWTVMKWALEFCGAFNFCALRYLFGTVILVSLLTLRRESFTLPPLWPTVLIGLAQTAGFQLLVQCALIGGGAGKTALAAMDLHFRRRSRSAVRDRTVARHRRPVERCAGPRRRLELGDRHGVEQARVSARAGFAIAAHRVANVVRHAGVVRGGADRATARDRLVAAVPRRADVQRGAVFGDRLGIVVAGCAALVHASRGTDQSGGAYRGRTVRVGVAARAPGCSGMARHRADRRGFAGVELHAACANLKCAIIPDRKYPSGKEGLGHG